MCGFFKLLLANKVLIYVAMHKAAPEAVFLLSKEKKGPHLKIYKLNNNNKVIKKLKSPGMGKKSKQTKKIFSYALKLDGEQML